MELHVTLAVLLAALFHAIWNSLIKGGKDPLLDSMLISNLWLVICAVLIPFIPTPDPKSWPYIAVSALVHVTYFLLLSKCYNTGELGRVYPIIRGLPPLIISALSFIILKENISFYGWVGVVTISIGILTLEIGNKTPSHKVFILSIITATAITAYTIIDGLGARLSGNSTSFLAWQSIFQSLVFTAIVIKLRSKRQCLEHFTKYWKRGSIGGILSFLAYAIVLWAITQAPIPYVSALRETSVLFAIIIAVIFLAETAKVSRFFSAIIIVIGITIMKLG